MAAFSVALLRAAALVALAACAASQDWKVVEISDPEQRYMPRSDNALGLCGTKVCLLGGRDAEDGEVMTADVFDTKTRKWERKEGNEVGVHHFQIAPKPDDVDSDCVWVGGAWKGFFPFEETVDDIYQFCADSGKWSVVDSIARPRGAGGAISYEGKYYLVGGNVGGHGAHSKSVPWFDVYDPDTKEWTELTDIPNPRDHFFAAVLDGKLYVAGGRDGADPDIFTLVEPKIDVYNFATERWSTLDVEFPKPRGGLLATVDGDRIIYSGGEDSNLAYKDVYYFDGESFERGPDLFVGRHGTNFAACSGAVWLAGGVSMSGAEPKEEDTEVLFSGSTPPVCTKEGRDNADGSSTSDTSSSDGDEDGESEESSNSSDSDSDTVVPESSNPACFPASATVELESGDLKSMDELAIGDKVRVSGTLFSEVMFFSHKDPSAMAGFIRLELHTEDYAPDDIALELSPGHMLYVDGALKPARDVREGETVQFSSTFSGMSTAIVVSVTEVEGKGLYNPHTLHGDIAVNGVRTSGLTDALPREVAESMLSLAKVLYKVGGADATEQVNSAVLSSLRSLGVHGPGWDMLSLLTRLVASTNSSEL